MLLAEIDDGVSACECLVSHSTNNRSYMIISETKIMSISMNITYVTSVAILASTGFIYTVK